MSLNVLNRAKDPINYRPSTHHLLFKKDEQFDYRYNAYLRCCSYFTTLYEATIRGCHTHLMEAVVDWHLNNVPLKPISPKIPCLLIKSHLSIVDTTALVTEYFYQTDTQIYSDASITVHFQSSIYETNCVFDSIIQITELIKIIQRSREKSSIRRTTSSSFTSINSSDSDNPLKDLKLFLKEISITQLIIVISDIDSMNLILFQEMIIAFGSFVDIQIQFVLFSSSYCSLPFRLSNQALAILSVNQYESNTPWIIYDSYITELILNDEIPINITSEIMKYLHERYIRSHCCLKTTVDCILLCYEIHFQSKKSLLSMYNDVSWLMDVSLCLNH